MKKAPRLTAVFLLPIFAIIGSTWGVQRAHAATVSTFTGSWRLDSDGAGTGSVASRTNQSIDNLRGPIGSDFNGIFSFNGSIGNYSDEFGGPGCDPNSFSSCENWSGSLSGSVSFAAYNSQAEYTFKGTITAGSFSGTVTCDLEGQCLGENEATFSFTSAIWQELTSASRGPNGWTSAGTLDVGSCIEGCSPISIGTLSMTTITPTPEPASMALFGSGILAVATFVRRRLSKRSLRSHKA